MMNLMIERIEIEEKDGELETTLEMIGTSPPLIRTGTYFHPDLGYFEIIETKVEKPMQKVQTGIGQRRSFQSVAGPSTLYLTAITKREVHLDLREMRSIDSDSLIKASELEKKVMKYSEEKNEEETRRDR